jgi:hypothetical protein
MLIRGIAPALRGGAMLIRGIAPALRGGAMSVLLSTAVALAVAACSYEDRLSLGHHEPVDAPVFGEGVATAGQTAPASAGAAGAGIGTGFDAPMAPEPPARIPEPISPPVMHVDAGEPVAPPDAAIADTTIDCAPGMYTAELFCDVDPNMLPPGSRPPPGATAMRTSLAFTVRATPNAQWLAVSDATMMFDYVGFAFVAQLQGGLDCETETFHADIVDGAYATTEPFPASASFHGALEGRIDRRAGALFGSWWHGPAGGGPQCVGPWMAQPVR